MAYTGSKAATAAGSVLSIKISGAFVPVFEVRSLVQSGQAFGTEDVTNMNSTAREFTTTLLDSGTWEMVANRISTDPGQAGLSSSFVAGGVNLFTILLPKLVGQTTTGDLYAFSALIQEFSTSLNFDKVQTSTIKLKVSGPIVVTEGS